MGIQVSFRDIDTNEILLCNCPCDWKFEKGQVFNGFWGCNSTVEKVDLTMEFHTDFDESKRQLIVHQMVYVKRVSLF